MKKPKQTEKLKPFLPLIIIGIIALSCAVYFLLVAPYWGFSGKVPASVRQAYDEGTTLGLNTKSLSVCTKGTSKVYQVGYHTGFGGTISYYDKRGKHIGDHMYEDYPTDNKPPIDLTDYKCKVIKS